MYIPSRFIRIKSLLQKKQKRAYVRIQVTPSYGIRFNANQYSIYTNSGIISINYLPAKATPMDYVACIDENTPLYISYIQCDNFSLGEEAQIKIYNADTNELVYNNKNMKKGFRYDFQPEKYYYIELYHSAGGLPL